MNYFMEKFAVRMDEAGEGGGAGGAGAGAGANEADGKNNEGGDAGADDPGDQGDGKKAADGGPKTLEEALGLIGKLRNENAKHRTKNKTLEESLGKYDGELKKVKEALGIKDDAEDPKTQIANLQQTNEALQVEMSIMSLAMEHQIPAEQNKYFKFLLAEKFEALGEGEELTDEDLAEVISQVKAAPGAKKNAATGLNGKAPGNEGKDQGVTVEKFVSMSLAEKSELYGKNPQLYADLMTKANEKRMFR